jgi:Protein of unknown function (DUF3793)
MAFANKTTSRVNPSLRVFSEQILKHFADPLDCLTAHLMLECAEVLAGVKPANLISIGNRPQPCGRNLYRLWQSHHAELATRLGALTIKVLQTKEKSLLLLCYDSNQLERHLAHAGIRTLLRKAGYEADASTDVLLGELCRRIGNNDSFPHEIGLFIGYPAKDVAAFMGLIKLPFACQCLWKVYGNPEPSLDLAELFRCSRQRMGAVLRSGTQKALQLDHASHPFFCRSIDKEFQYHSLSSRTRPAP